MKSGTALLAVVTLQRAIELGIASRNTRRLIDNGGREMGAEHYPLMVALHASWLATLWMTARSRTVAPGFGVAYALLQAARVWVLATLGERWTTRIIIVPDREPITTGPFRFVRHPNYLVVALELPCVSLALRRYRHAAIFAALNLAMLALRIHAENAAFEEERSRSAGAMS